MQPKAKTKERYHLKGRKRHLEITRAKAISPTFERKRKPTPAQNNSKLRTFRFLHKAGTFYINVNPYVWPANCS